ncbi:hypothetical protein ACFVZH_11750 [Streptomyces sp. NPDC059534]|uniref:hypothetical protein n=1 Tax=Streptomyces sp. NPDC059534 TaxID=3346859 RepID=UPI0036823E96
MRRLAAPLLLAALALAGCTDGAPEAAGPPPSAPGESPADAALYDCLARQGLKLQVRDGNRRVDKDANSRQAMDAAQAVCGTPATAATVDPATLARDRRTSACVRRNGMTAYPDPDPTTGLLPENDELKYDPRLPELLRRCAPAPEDTRGGTVVGG